MSNAANESRRYNGWIPWYGGLCPVGSTDIVEVEFKSGGCSKSLAFGYDWGHTGYYRDITAYRVVKSESAIERMNMDVLREAKEIQAAKQERKEFFDKLDKQGLLFETYLFAVMGRFQCDADQAGKYIHEYLKGE
jgi:hypothetical protein